MKGSPRELPAQLWAGSPGERLTRQTGKGAERPTGWGSQVFAGPLADLITDQPARPTRNTNDHPTLKRILLWYIKYTQVCSAG